MKWQSIWKWTHRNAKYFGLLMLVGVIYMLYWHVKHQQHLIQQKWRWQQYMRRTAAAHLHTPGQVAYQIAICLPVKQESVSDVAKTLLYVIEQAQHPLHVRVHVLVADPHESRYREAFSRLMQRQGSGWYEDRVHFYTWLECPHPAAAYHYLQTQVYQGETFIWHIHAHTQVLLNYEALAVRQWQQCSTPAQTLLTGPLCQASHFPFHFAQDFPVASSHTLRPYVKKTKPDLGLLQWAQEPVPESAPSLYYTTQCAFGPAHIFRHLPGEISWAPGTPTCITDQLQGLQLYTHGYFMQYPKQLLGLHIKPSDVWGVLQEEKDEKLHPMDAQHLRQLWGVEAGTSRFILGTQRTLASYSEILQVNMLLGIP